MQTILDLPTLTTYYATGLLSQQLGCFGQDMIREDGIWLVEQGFERTPPSEKQKDCGSIYTLRLSRFTRILLCGFGAIFVDDHKGRVFLERFPSSLQFTEQTRLAVGPWSCEDLPPIAKPSDDQWVRCRWMLMEWIDWFIGYKVHVHRKLGVDDRSASLASWYNGNRCVVSAELISCFWRHVKLLVTPKGFENIKHEIMDHQDAI